MIERIIMIIIAFWRSYCKKTMHLCSKEIPLLQFFIFNYQALRTQNTHDNQICRVHRPNENLTRSVKWKDHRVAELSPQKPCRVNTSIPLLSVTRVALVSGPFGKRNALCMKLAVIVASNSRVIAFCKRERSKPHRNWLNATESLISSSRFT